jgi:hypothetical protein
MSYDLMVFNPEAAPKTHQAFLDWFTDAMEAGDGICFMDPAVATAPLRDWYADMVEIFPNLNGPGASEELPEDEATASDYSIGKDAIYVCFAWSKTEQAYSACFELAEKHQVGFFNAQSSEVWLPGPAGLKIAYRKTLLDRITSRFRGA